MAAANKIPVYEISSNQLNNILRDMQALTDGQFNYVGDVAYATGESMARSEDILESIKLLHTIDVDATPPQDDEHSNNAGDDCRIDGAA